MINMEEDPQKSIKSVMALELKGKCNGENDDMKQELQEFLRDTVMNDEWCQDQISDEELLEAIGVLEDQTTDEVNSGLNLEDVSKMIDDAIGQSDDASFDELLDFLTE